MKLGTALLILGLALPVAAQGPQRSEGGRGQNRRQMDTNKDGRISRDEWKGPADMFDRVDSNHDGSLSADEIRNGRQGRMDFSQIDTNHDGRVSKNEWKGPANMFDKIDSNHDGALTQEEMKNGRQRSR